MTNLQIGVFIVWAALLIGLVWLMKHALDIDKEKFALALVPVFSALLILFVVYAANVFGVDIEQVKDILDTVDNDDGGGATTTNG